MSEVDILMKKVGFRNKSKAAYIPVWGQILLVMAIFCRLDKKFGWGLAQSVIAELDSVWTRDGRADAKNVE